MLSTEKQLVFRLGGVGFLLKLDHVVEIVDSVAGRIDPARSDISRAIVCALYFRSTWIPIVDPALKMNLQPSLPLPQRTAVVLQGNEGGWAILVDQMVRLVPAAKLQPCELPQLLKVQAVGCYSQVKLLNNEPLVVFETDNFYGTIP
jgi:chemotaxis signal transduction protein